MLISLEVERIIEFQVKTHLFKSELVASAAGIDHNHCQPMLLFASLLSCIDLP